MFALESVIACLQTGWVGWAERASPCLRASTCSECDDRCGPLRSWARCGHGRRSLGLLGGDGGGEGVG